ncbi:MAG: hypothetical protein EOM24_12595 [Chloroflexia bacterium]|nr:hypothetical protein [Chloroflexia bacterium]
MGNLSGHLLACLSAFLLGLMTSLVQHLLVLAAFLSESHTEIGKFLAQSITHLDLLLTLTPIARNEALGLLLKLTGKFTTKFHRLLDARLNLLLKCLIDRQPLLNPLTEALFVIKRTFLG